VNNKGEPQPLPFTVGLVRRGFPPLSSEYKMPKFRAKDDVSRQV
jgi:hypothetical protein